MFRLGERAWIPSQTSYVAVPWPLTNVHGALGSSLFAIGASRMAANFDVPDIVHVHGDFTEAWPLSGYARRVGAPLVVTVHGGLNPRFRQLSRVAFSNVDAFIALGDRVASDLERCGVHGDRITSMSSGLNLELLAGASSTRGREAGLIVMTGSLDPVKNIPAVIQAVLGLPESLGAHLEIFGDGPQRRELELLIGSSDRITLMGQVSRAEWYERASMADAFVMASRRLGSKGEGVPTALLEAMALGKMCIVSTDAEPKPVVRDSKSYVRFHPSDTGALRAALQLALTSASVRTSYGAQAARAVEHLGWGQVGDRVDQIYERAIKRGRSDQD